MKLTNEDILQFKKRKLYDLQYYRKLLDDTEAELQTINTQLTSIKSYFSDPGPAAIYNPAAVRYYKLSEKSADLEAQKSECIEKINALSKPLDKLNPEDKRLLEYIFVENGSYKAAAKLFNCPETSLFRKVNTLLSRY